jgi:hypothetical protein
VIGGLIRWSKLPILGSAIIGAFVLGGATSLVGIKGKPLMSKTRDFLQNSKLQKTLSSQVKLARKMGAGGLRLTSDLLSLSADLINPESTWEKANKQLRKK